MGGRISVEVLSSELVFGGLVEELFDGITAVDVQASKVVKSARKVEAVEFRPLDRFGSWVGFWSCEAINGKERKGNDKEVLHIGVGGKDVLLYKLGI